MTSLYHEMGTLSAREPFSGSGQISLSATWLFFNGSMNLNRPSCVAVRAKWLRWGRIKPLMILWRCYMDRSGILAQAGFAFQMNVFLKQVTELTPGAVARYEYLDDISASTGLDELSGQIGLCETQLFQVKNTNVSKQDVIQIYTNWILADCEQESISSFWLLYSNQKLSLSFLMLLPPVNSSRCWIRGRKSPTGQTLQN